jgi:hypothetical protein
VDGPVERVDVGKGLMRQVMRLEVVPDHLDVVEFWGIFGQPLDREPVCAGGKRGRRELAGVDRAVILDEYPAVFTDDACGRHHGKPAFAHLRRWSGASSSSSLSPLPRSIRWRSSARSG